MLKTCTPDDWYSYNTDFTTSHPIPYPNPQPLILMLLGSPCLCNHTHNQIIATTRTVVTMAGYFDKAYRRWRHWQANPSNGTASTLEATSLKRTIRIYTLAGLPRVSRGWPRSWPVAQSISRCQKKWSELPFPITVRAMRSSSKSSNCSRSINCHLWRQEKIMMSRKGWPGQGWWRPGGQLYARYTPGDSGWLPGK